MPWLGPLFFILSQLASVSLRFLWGLALTTLRNRKPMRLRTSAIVRGEGRLRTIPLRSERRQGRCGSQPRGGQARAKRRGLWRMRSGELTQRVSHLRRRLFPAFAATAGRLRTETKDASASLGQAKRHRLAAPTKDGFRQQGIAATLLQRPLGLKGAPGGAGHGGCR